MNNENIDLKTLQTSVDKWIKTHGVRYFNELTNMAILTEEVGELARVMARTYGEQSFKEGEEANLADEHHRYRQGRGCSAGTPPLPECEVQRDDSALHPKTQEIENGDNTTKKTAEQAVFFVLVL